MPRSNLLQCRRTVSSDRSAQNGARAEKTGLELQRQGAFVDFDENPVTQTPFHRRILPATYLKARNGCLSVRLADFVDWQLIPSASLVRAQVRHSSRAVASTWT
jgi:hypothetical protein